MRLTFLGTGAAFCNPPNYQSNLLLTSDSGRNLLIDCGTDIRFSLTSAGFKLEDIDAIYISHLHADHVGGMEYVGYSTRYSKSPQRLPLYINESIVDDIWVHCLYAGMNITEGDESRLQDFFKVHTCPNGEGFDWEGTRFHLVPTHHIVGNEKIMYSYGLYFELGQRKVYFTADTLYAYSDKNVAPIMDEADIILHDCETSETATKVHAHFSEMLELPAAIKAKTWLYHYSDGELPDAKAAGFAGFVERGQIFEFK